LLLFYKNNTSFKNLLLILSLFTISCNYTKHLQNNQILLNKNSIKLSASKPIKYKGEFESSIVSLISPPANSHVFDLDFLPKYKLWKYNNRFQYFEKNENDKKVVKHKVEKPVLLDSLAIIKTEKNITQFLINQGYYFSEVSSDVTVKNKQANVTYHIKTGKSYLIESVSFTVENEELSNELEELKHNSFLKKGMLFTNNTCGLERERIYRTLRNKGYFDFKTDNTNFSADTSNTKKIIQLLDDPFESSLNFSSDSSQEDSIRILVNIEQTKDSTYFVKYSIDSVIVSIIDNDMTRFSPTALEINNVLDNIYFKYKRLPVNRKVLTRNIFVQAGSEFNLSDPEATINRLNQLNIFKNVNLKFDKHKDKKGKLICRINLTLNEKYDYQVNTDISASNDGDYFLGLGAALIYRDKNLFFGANQLSVRGAYSLQTRRDPENGKLEFSGNNINISSNLVFPKFIVPFNQNIFSKKNIPFTQLGLNLSYINRIDNYTILNFSGSFGYNWRETPQKTWNFTPSFISLNKVPDGLLSLSFKEKTLTNRYLDNIFSNSIIYGENLVFQYRSKPKKIYGNFNSLRIGFEEAGTILKGINTLYFSVTNKNIEPIAHYVKLDVDYRKYINFRKSQWVNRVLIGLGKPMGGSLTLPYLKQYSSGGQASIRGWAARTLGPGRAQDSTYKTSNTIIDQTGDMKFELNTEYRFNLLKMFSGVINVKGAIFADIGNVWLYNKSASIPGGEFNPAYFFNDLAIASGYGLRFDFSFFVFRLDIGNPIKSPIVSKNYGFDFNNLKIKKGMVNIAINYPF
jgi:outer membrane protein assembly factor BamA